MYEVTVAPLGPFDLWHQNQFFGGWPVPAGGRTIVLAFPVERDWDSAAVEVAAEPNGTLRLSVRGPSSAAAQALAALSLDVDARDWPLIGQRDRRIGALQEQFDWLRPSLFHSPYEAAAAFVIGHRISIATTRRLRARLAADHGVPFDIGGQHFHAFPDPRALLRLESFPGLNATKIERLHGVARAALDGWLDRAFLRELDVPEALNRLEGLPGIGPFFAQGILHRGAGTVDGLTHDDMTYAAFGALYGIGESPSRSQILAIAEAHRPFGMWATVLAHVWFRQQRPPLRRQSPSRSSARS